MRRKRAELDEWELQLPVSMIDVTFLLLVFFICTARFKALEQRLDAGLSREGPVDGPPPEAAPEVWVRVARSGIVAGRKRCRDLNALARALAELRGAVPDLHVVLDARDDVPFRLFLGSLDACKRARVEHVKFAAPVGPGS